LPHQTHLVEASVQCGALFLCRYKHNIGTASRSATSAPARTAPLSLFASLPAPRPSASPPRPARPTDAHARLRQRRRRSHRSHRSHHWAAPGQPHPEAPSAGRLSHHQIKSLIFLRGVVGRPTCCWACCAPVRSPERSSPQRLFMTCRTKSDWGGCACKRLCLSPAMSEKPINKNLAAAEKQQPFPLAVLQTSPPFCTASASAVFKTSAGSF
jgi:hypothetical protein